ncbi:hypothetical protein [Streptomyces sp. NPDC059909]|uniref:hypothetical protein n=1 Tax=Streptomyces sp. NPDC059909 TaxID=3346998 RepID=UPI0036680430
MSQSVSHAGREKADLATIRAKARRINAAFQEVLDDPAAEEAPQHPALKQLPAQAAS